MLTVHYYYRFKVSLDYVVELMSMRGIYLSHHTVHNWSQIFNADLGVKSRISVVNAHLPFYKIILYSLKYERQFQQNTQAI